MDTEKLKEVKRRKIIWLNIFIRDLLLVVVVLGLGIMTNFNSKVVFLIMGMMVVWITWQFSDFLNYIRLRSIFR